jgi:hypothetical protein
MQTKEPSAGCGWLFSNSNARSGKTLTLPFIFPLFPLSSSHCAQDFLMLTNTADKLGLAHGKAIPFRCGQEL